MKARLTIFKVLLILSALGVSGYALSYFSFEIKSILMLKENLNRQLWYKLIFYTHVGLGAIALTLGSLQFFEKWVKHRWRIHKKLGKIYFYSVMISGIAGLVMALNAYGGFLSKAGFFILSVGWLSTSILGVRAILGQHVVLHRRWMMRSYAFCCAAITFRIGLGVFPLMGFSFETTYVINSWLCWVVNVIIIEFYLCSKSFLTYSPSPQLQRTK